MWGTRRRCRGLLYGRAANAGLRVVMRGKVVRTTIGKSETPSPLDRFNRQFRVESTNQLGSATSLTSRLDRAGCTWPLSSTCLLDALEQGLYASQPEQGCSMICHFDTSSQYVSIRCTERSARAGVEPTAGRKGNSYNNALARPSKACTGRIDSPPDSPKNQGSSRVATLEWIS